MIRILIVEDEKNIANLIHVSLSQVGYHCEQIGNGREAAELLETKSYDLILLDVMLPGLDGFSLMEYIRDYRIPVIFLTARGDTRDKVRGLRMGAEDYITKPFDIAELIARVEVVLRRFRSEDTIISIDDLVVDLESHVVTKDGQPVSLTLKEFEILALFLKNRNIALYRETIYERVWQEPYMGDTRTVDLHVQRMRRKTGLENRICAVYKVGYRFDG